MANNFFDLVKENFFSPFMSKSKRYNYDLLQLINSKMSLDNLQVTKDDIVSWIIDYVGNCPINMMIDDDTEETDVKSYAYERVRYFVRCGWLIEDFEGIRVTYQLDENGIKLLSAMENAVKDDTKSLEFSGYVYNIYNNLYHYNFDHAVDIIEQVYAASKELNSMLRGLNVNIKKYLTKLLSENEAMPREILKTIFVDYQKKVVLKSFKNFREKDNPSKYKIYIENKIDELLSFEELERMIANYLKVKHDGVNSENNYFEAKEFFETRLIYIKDQFEEIEDYIQMLDRRNTKYIETARSRLNFLLNEEINVEGKLIDCLKGISQIDDALIDDQDLFEIYYGLNIDEYSLYRPKIKKHKEEQDQLIEEYNDNEEEVNALINKLFIDNGFSVIDINNFVNEQMKNKNVLYGKDIEINEFSDIIKVFLLQIYSENKTVNYKITFLDETFNSLGYKMNDFILERK